MAQFKIVSWGRANVLGDYTHEMEALQGVDAQIVEVAAETDEEFLEKAQDADALILSGHGLSDKVIRGLKQCRIIALDSVGTNHVAVAVATAKGIPVTNCPDINIQEVAEHTVTLILAAHRRLLLMDKTVREGFWWEGHEPMRQLPRLFGQTLGLVSFGNIPRAVVPLLKPFGLRLLAHDPYVMETLMIQYGVEPVGLTELLQRSDIITNHVPGSGGTTKMIGEEQFRLMKPTAIFVNTGRGTTVDEAAMIRALDEGWIAHAALDVLEKEPPDPNNPLFGMENVTLTPHVASASSRVRAVSKRRMGMEVALVLSGRRPLSCVNPSVLAGSGLLKWQS
ncbi:MAG: C-terminal binding protein [Chloroflexota bacterium]|nr:C-terminal binding protein [Chloroflexota bacterium]MDE2840807.1 C-terminal binding protein [Chloroflexota bacterium]